MKITLADLDYNGITINQQFMKIQEEKQELKAELFGYGYLNQSHDRAVEEAFDLIQSVAGMLVILGVDIEAANRKHLEKMKGKVIGK